MVITAPRDATAQVRHRLLELIKSGGIRPDGKLPTERELARQFDIGRRHVRQALNSLEEEGLVWRKQGKGTFVGQPADPISDLAAKVTGETSPLEVMEARLCIEPELAALCAVRMLPEEIARLRRLAERQFEATDAQAVELWDGSLHRLIAQCARNRPLLTSYSLLEKIRSNPDWVAIRAKGRNKTSLQVTYNEHGAIIDAIEARHPENARIAMRDHLETRFQALREELGATAAERGDMLFEAGIKT